MQKIKCLICDKEFVKPMSHVWQKHGISAREYKKKFGFDLTRGIIPQEHKELLKKNVSERIKETLKRNGKKTRFRGGDPLLGNYKRSHQTNIRLKIIGKKIGKNYS